jgi:transposase-like protein
MPAAGSAGRARVWAAGRPFTRTTPRGKPVEVKRHAIELDGLGLSMNAGAKRVGVSAQSMLRWVRDHA